MHLPPTGLITWLRKDTKYKSPRKEEESTNDKRKGLP